MESQTPSNNLMDFQATPPETIQDLGQASQMIEAQYPPSQSLVDLMTTEDLPAPSLGIGFPAETINYLPEPTQTAPTQDLISFEDPLGEMSQLNEEDREAIEATYPPLFTGSGGQGIGRPTPRPAASQVRARRLQSGLTAADRAKEHFRE